MRGAADTATHPGICPACGIAYAKWRQPAPAARPEPSRSRDVEPSTLARLLHQLDEPPEGGIAARAVLLAALAAWTLWFIAHGIDWEVIGGSFLHNANLAFHEFGHVAFRPLGDFMAIAGGSIFQVLLPLVLCGYFVLRVHDNIAAAVALWWCGQNLLDLAPYIRDAEYRLLPLVGGHGEESHDWGNLLTILDAVPSCYALARTSFGLGVFVMCIALGWGARLLWRQHQRTS